MSVEAISWALNDAPVDNPTSKLVLISLANHAHPDGSSAFPSVARMVRYTCLSERAVRQHLTLLEQAGVISRSDQRIVAAYIDRADRRPVGYNLNLHLKKLEKGEVQDMQVVEQRGASDDTNGVHQMQERGAGDAPKPSINRTDKPSSIGEELANKFRHSWKTTGPKGAINKPIPQLWVTCFNKMIGEDGRDPELIEQVFTFGHEHAFWGRILGTPMTLRKHFDAVNRQRHAEALAGPSIDQAWAEVALAATSLGRWGTPEWSSDAIRLTVSDITWERICLGNARWAEQEFRAKYPKIVRRLAS